MTSEFIINDKRTSFRLDVNVNIAYREIDENNYYLCKDAIDSGSDIYKWDLQIENIKKDLSDAMNEIKGKAKDDKDIISSLNKIDLAIETLLAARGRIFSSSNLLYFEKYYNQQINLSEGGIKFTVHKHYYPRTKLLVSLDLLSGQDKILAFATIQHVDIKANTNIGGLFDSENKEESLDKYNQYTVKVTLDFFNKDGKAILKKFLEDNLRN